MKPGAIEAEIPEIEITEVFDAEKRHKILNRVLDQNEIILRQNENLITMITMIPITIRQTVDENIKFK